MPLPQERGAGPSLGPPPATCLCSAPPGALIGSCWQVPRGEEAPGGRKKRVTSQLQVGFFRLFLRCRAAVPALEGYPCCVLEGGGYKAT